MLLERITTRIAAVSMTLLLAACAGNDWRTEDPDARLDEVLAEWQAAMATGGCRRPLEQAPGVVDCDAIAFELRRLAATYPNRPDVLYANALVAWEEGNANRAVSWLDALLARDPAHVNGAVLRARLSLEEGNLPYARRLLEETIDLVPDASGLREMLSSIAYFEGDYGAARRELRIARALGAPAWRVDYNYGLIWEAQGDLERARSHYDLALAGNPSFDRARMRLSGIDARVSAGEQ